MKFIFRIKILLLNYVETRKTYGKILLVIKYLYNTSFAPVSNYERSLSYTRGLQVQWPWLFSALNRSLCMSIYVNTALQISNFTKTVQRLQSYYLHTEGNRDVAKLIVNFCKWKRQQRSIKLTGNCMFILPLQIPAGKMEVNRRVASVKQCGVIPTVCKFPQVVSISEIPTIVFP